MAKATFIQLDKKQAYSLADKSRSNGGKASDKTQLSPATFCILQKPLKHSVPSTQAAILHVQVAVSRQSTSKKDQGTVQLVAAACDMAGAFEFVQLTPTVERSRELHVKRRNKNLPTLDICMPP